VRVAEHGDAVGTDFDDLIHGASKAFCGLERQPVDEVHVDAVEPQAARAHHQVARQFITLDAVHRLLDFRREVLHTHA
jgi:hypothetical protein